MTASGAVLAAIAVGFESGSGRFSKCIATSIGFLLAMFKRGGVSIFGSQTHGISKKHAAHCTSKFYNFIKPMASD